MAGDAQKIAVGMSGGVDSSVAAALLVEEGREVVGVTLLLRDRAIRRVTEQDAERAAEVARALGIPHHVMDVREEFEAAIVSYFVDSYARGRTPSPCVLCNPTIKFGYLLDRVRELGCDALATGHYAKIMEAEDGRHLYRARDRDKDQSYFLHRLDQAQLEAAAFPLGNRTKTEVKRLARDRNLPVAFHAESQDLCFVDADDYAGLVESYHPHLCEEGDIVDEDGETVGTHAGIHRYTVGQRKGLGVSSSKPLYVKRVDAEANEVVVAPRERATADRCMAEDVNWIPGRPSASAWRCSVRIRYRHPGAPARVEVSEDGRTAEIRFDEPQFAVTPGQAAVFYVEDEVVGGGWIA